MSEEQSVGHLTVSKHPTATLARAGQSISTGGAGGNSPITPGFLWYVACRWGKLALPLGLLTMMLAVGLVLYLFEPQYRAEALLQIKKQKPIVAMHTIESGASNEYVETQKQLLRSFMVLTNVLANPEIARLPELRREEDPKKWIEKHLEVKAIGGSELISVAYQGPNAENAKIIVDAVVNAYIALQDTDNQKQIRSLLNALDLVKQEQIDNVVRLEELVQKTAKEYAGDTALVIKPNGQSLLELSPAVMGLQQRLIDAEFNRQMTAIQLKAYEEQGAPPQPPLAESAMETLVAGAPEIAELKNRILVSQKNLKALQKDTVHFKRVERAVRDYETELEEARQRVRERLIEEHNNSMAAAGRDRLAEMKTLLAEYQLLETALRTRLDVERRKIENQTGNQYKLEFLTNDLARSKEVADKIEDRIFALKIEYLSPHRPEQVFIRHLAETPRTPIEAFPLKSASMAGLVGLFFPFAAFGAFELLSRRLYQSHQLQDRSQLTLLGEVTALPSRPFISSGGAVRRYQKYRAIFEESVESLRSVLSVSSEWADVRVLAITSAVAREGKTSLASQLAIGWARHSESRTLIIDGDVRDPDVHSIFGIAKSPGLAEVLRSDCEQDSAIVHWEGRLDILPAGNLIANPHRLFAGKDFAELIERLRSRYDRIIVDMAPVLSASEALPMLKEVDGVLLCARKDHSRVNQIRLARERLERAGIRRVGGIFGGMSSSSYAYQYGEYTG